MVSPRSADKQGQASRASDRIGSPSQPSERNVDRSDPVGDDLVFSVLADVADDESLSALLGVDLAPAAPDSAHAPRILPSLADWLGRAEEAYVFLQAARERLREPE